MKIKDRAKLRRIIYNKYEFIRIFEKYSFFIFVMLIGMAIQYITVVLGLEFVFIRIFSYVVVVALSFSFILLCLVVIAWVVIFFIYCYECYQYLKSKK